MKMLLVSSMSLTEVDGMQIDMQCAVVKLLSIWIRADLCLDCRRGPIPDDDRWDGRT